MLIRFTCQNFKSIGMTPIQLDMVSSAKIRTLRGHICASSSRAKTLRNAVVYGANAAGKSNLIKALSFMRASVLAGSIPQEGIKEFCKCQQGYANDETTFEVQFQVQGRAYDYGFSCILAKMQVTSEWLYRLESKASPVFTRNGPSEIDCGELEASLSRSDLTRLGVYKEDFINKNARSTGSGLFLTAMAADKSFDEDSPLHAFGESFQWFDSGIEIIGPGAPTSSAEFYSSGRSLDQVAEVLSSFDTGISGLAKRDVPMDELDRYVPMEVLFALRELLQANGPGNDQDRFVVTVRNSDYFLGVERKGLEEPKATILKTSHDNSLLEFDFHDESDGTKRLFDFMDLLFTSSPDKVFVVDELNLSFHPMLTQHLVKLFNQVHADDDCQLVFTTHENDIMSYEYFRRDEIWFVDRDANGLSSLYPLDDFASSGARSDARLGKRYLEGRYGAVPVLSSAKALAALGVLEG